MTQPSTLMDLLRCPVVVAPMAGGPSTADLVVAAARAGALGFLAAGYKTPGAMAGEIAAVRAATSQPFGVNVLVPGTPYPDAAALASYLGSLGPAADLGEATWDDDGFDGKVAALLADPPPVVSFTFGCPPAGLIGALRGAGAVVAITVTSPGEAAIAAAAGADALCVQGFEAGAHRGTFANDDAPGRDYGLLSLIGEVAAVTGLPQVAAGGIMSRPQLQAVIAAGASAWSRMNRLTSPRAGRPLKARVSVVAVYRGSASAALYDGWAPLSGQRKKAVPHWAATAPAASTARSWRGPMMPPAATCGSPVTAATSPISDSRP